MIISVFRYLNAKDIFEAHYTKFLSRRLINKKSENNQMELDFVAKLKDECGAQFTSRVEQMFVDISNSEALMQEYGEDRRKKGNKQ